MLKRIVLLATVIAAAGTALTAQAGGGQPTPPQKLTAIRAGRLISQGPVEKFRGDDVLRQVYLSDSKFGQREGSEA